MEKLSSLQVTATHNLHIQVYKYWDKTGQLVNEEYYIVFSLISFVDRMQHDSLTFDSD